MDELGFPSQWAAWLLLLFRARTSRALYSVSRLDTSASAVNLCHHSWRGGIIPIRLLTTAEEGSGNGPYWVINTLFKESYMVLSIWKWKPALGRGSTTSMLARTMLPEWPGTTPWVGWHWWPWLQLQCVKNEMAKLWSCESQQNTEANKNCENRLQGHLWN